MHDTLSGLFGLLNRDGEDSKLDAPCHTGWWSPLDWE